MDQGGGGDSESCEASWCNSDKIISKVNYKVPKAEYIQLKI